MKNKNKGFTLLELMMVVAIAGVLAAIALPAYNEYVRRAQRVDATAALLRIQGAQERFYLNNNRYATSAGALGITSTENDYYTLAITATAPTENFTATATAKGPQLADEDCRVFSITGQGTRTATDAGGSDNSAACWR